MIEGEIRRLRRPLAFRLAIRDVAHDALHEADVLRHPRDEHVVGRVAAAGAVAVHVRDAVLRKIARERVRIPGRAGEASGRMAGPPRDAHAALEPVAMGPEHARDLEHAGVTGGVVADADVP